MERILTTHAGSLVRPRALLDFLAAEARGESYDQAAYERALADAVDRRGAAPGRGRNRRHRRRRDGQVRWITYLYERVSGLEQRMVPLEGGSILPPSRDRQAFPEFYAEHDAAFARAVENQVPIAGLDRTTSVAAEIEPRGMLWFCTGPIAYDPSALERDIARLKSALAGVEVADVFLPVVAPASVYWLHNEYYASEEEFVFAVADALHEEYRRIVDAGFLLQVDDAVLHARVRLDPLARRLGRATTGAGRSCGSRRSTTRSRESRRSASATTSASAAGTARTPSTHRSRTSSTSCSGCGRATT